MMAKKICLSCGLEMGVLTGKVKVFDGYVCVDCWMQAGFSTSLESLGYSSRYTGTEIANIITTLEQNKIAIQSFNATSRISCVEFDDVSCKVAIKLPNSPEILDYKQIVDFELLEDGECITKGGFGQAIVGGALLGGVGAVVGGVAGAKKTKNICNSLTIKITVRDYIKQTVYVPLIKTPSKTSGVFYRQAYNDAQDILSALQLSVDKVNSPLQTPPDQKTSPFSAADEIKKFKQLYDEGIITKEEFEEKKKSLLSL